MSVMRVNKNKNYTVMSNHHLKNKEISLKAKGLLSVMLSLPDSWDYSISGLCAICKENETAIKNALKELRDYRYVIVTKKMPDKDENRSKIEYVYDIYEEPQKEKGKTDLGGENQHIENQGLENLSLENQVVENHTQLNTYITNTKDQSTNNKRTNTSNTDKYAFTEESVKGDDIYSSSPEAKEDEARINRNRFIPSDYSYEQLRDHILTPIGECVQSEFGGDLETINTIADIVVQFCKDYENHFGRKHRVPTDDACKNIVFQFYNPPEAMDGINDFESYMAMMAQYFKTNFNQNGGYSGTVEKSVSHFMSRKVRENLYYKTLY